MRKALGYAVLRQDHLEARRMPALPQPTLYAHHFGLDDMPFTLTPDTRFYFAHYSYSAALNTLLVATHSGEGFIKITGEVGTGKTLLCRKFLTALEGDFITAYIPNPYLEPMTLLLAIADELGISYSDDVTQHRLLKDLTLSLLRSYSKSKRPVVVCLDEAHAMPQKTLEFLRLLSNLETQKHKLLQLVLFGQPELDQRLAQRELRQLRQRISFSCKLMPLSIHGVSQYIYHRLHRVGFDGPRIFSDQAIKLIYKASQGVPRLVNILSHKAMMATYGEGGHNITVAHVRAAIADTESVAGFKEDSWSRPLSTLAALPAAISCALVMSLTRWLR